MSRRLFAPARCAAILALTLVLTLLTAAPAAAHAELVSSSPQDGQTLTTPPSLVAMHFTENVAPKLSHFFLTVPSGTRTEVPAQVQGQDVTLNVSNLAPQGAAAVGKYVVEGQVTAADDGHQSTMRIGFAVQAAGQGQTVPAPGSGTSPMPGMGGTGQTSGLSGSAAAPARTPTSPGSRLWIIVLVSVVAVAGALSMRRHRP